MGKRYSHRPNLVGRLRRPLRSGYLSSLFGLDSVASSAYTGLWVILVVFVGLAILNSLIVPITQGEDELAHYRYISFIAQTGRLPADFAEREQAWYRADWPPLYHLLVGWTVSPLDTTRPHLKDVGESPRRRLVGEIFYPRLIIYTEDANWPWQDGILAWHLGRFISIAFAAGALVFTYLTVLETGRFTFYVLRSRSAFSLQPSALAIATTALLAFTPRYLFTSAMLGDDSLFILLSAIFIWLLLRTLRGDDRWWIYALIGLVLGLSITTKYSTGLLPLAVIPVVWWRVNQAGWSGAKASGRVIIAWVFTVIGAGWWFGWIGYYFNTIEEDGLFAGLLSPLLAAGPDVSMRRVFAFFSGGQFTGLERPEAVAAGAFGDWLTYLFQTFWGVPVLEHDPLFPWAYLLMLLICLAALFGLWQFWSTANRETRVTIGVLVFIVALLLPFPILRFFLTHNVLETGQGRHILYPAAQAIPILLILGWAAFGRQVCEFAKQRTANRRSSEAANNHATCNSILSQAEETQHASRLTPHASRLTPHASRLTPHASVRRPVQLRCLPVGRLTLHVSLIPTLLLVWSVFQLVYITNTYPDPLPVQTTTFDPATIPQPLEHKFGENIQFLGYDFVPDPELAIINLTLYWQALNPVAESYRTRVQLVDPDGQPHFIWLSHPVNGLYPTRAWDQGDVIRDELPLPLAAVPANNYSIQIDLLREAEDTPLNDEPFAIIQFDLPTRQPIANAATLDNIDYRLWGNDAPIRHRQTIALSWADSATGTPAKSKIVNPKWSLLGPDDNPRFPAAAGDATAIFIVGADWPSGDYRLQLRQNGAGSRQTEPLLTVANEARLFSLPEAAARQLVPVEATFAEVEGQSQIRLLGYILPTRRIEPGGGLPLTLYWQSLAPVLADTLTFAVLLDETQQPHGSVDRYPSGFYSPMLWAEREIVVDDFTVPIQPDAPPGIYSLHLGQYQLLNRQPNSLALWQEGQPAGTTAVVIGPIKVGGPPPGLTIVDPRPQFVLNQTLGNQITLLGYDLTQLNPQNSTLDMTLYWRADANPTTDYTTFLHLRNAANENVAQQDRPPAAGRYPTSLWETGEIVLDEPSLPLEAVPPGRYTPVVGLYELTTGTRLAVPGVPANEITLEPVEVKK